MAKNKGSERPEICDIEEYVSWVLLTTPALRLLSNASGGFAMGTADGLTNPTKFL
jgi:hypothetical protein